MNVLVGTKQCQVGGVENEFIDSEFAPVSFASKTKTSD